MPFLPLTSKTAEAYAQAFRGLLPRGHYWDWVWDAWLEDLALGVGDSLSTWHSRLVDASLEAFPGTADETLDAWERIASLPDPLATPTTTDSERRAALVGRLGAYGGQDRPYFEAFSDRMLEIEESLVSDHHGGDVFRVGISRAGDRLAGLWAAYFWVVEVPSTIAAGDADRLERYLERMKPAHTQVLVVVLGAEDRLLDEDGPLIITEDWIAIEVV